MPFLRKYNTLLLTGNTAIRIPIIKRSSTDFALGADWTPAAGDVKISVNSTAPTNVTNLPTAITYGNGAIWEFMLTGAELSCKQSVVTISDAATKVIEDQCFIVETFGNASAMYVADFSTANIPANVVQFAGQTAVAAGSVTLPSTVASPTNITAGVITTVTNLTNAPTAGDLTATMKTSVTTAATAATPVAASVTARVNANVDRLNGDAASAATLAMLNSANVVYRGVITGATTTTSLIDSGLTQAATDWWKGRIIIFVTGLPSQATDITAFDATLDKLTFSPVTSAPAGGSNYIII